MGRHATRAGQASSAETRPPLPYPVNDGRVAPTAKAVMERRSQRRKSRLAAASAAAMLALGGAAGVGMAMADEPESGSGSEIVFSGGCGTLSMLGPNSKPDSSELSVVKGTKVSYSNDLGTDAELHVGGEVYEVSDGSTQVFVMNRSAEVAMVPDCKGLFADYQSAQVNVTAPPEGDDAEPAEEPAGSDADLPAPDDDGDDADAAAPDSGGDEPAGAGSTPQDGSGAGLGEGPEAEDKAGVPGEEDEAAEDEDLNAFGPSDDEETPAGDEFAPAGDEEVAAVDPKAVSDGASGLLALVAIVCLVGVSAAVMRTILKQRATA